MRVFGVSSEEIGGSASSERIARVLLVVRMHWACYSDEHGP